MATMVETAVRERAEEGMLPCAVAFQIAEELGVTARAVGNAANATDVRLAECQLGLFGYGEHKSIFAAAEEVAPELEQAIREGLVLGRMPCAVAWAIAKRFGLPKVQVTNAAEWLGIKIGQCQLGAF
jgi:hypothetical protein